MEEDQIQQMIDASIKKASLDAQFGVVPIPAHAHTGVDSAQVDRRDLIGFPTVIDSYTSTGTPTPNVNDIDVFDISAATGAIAFQNPVGVPVNGQIFRIRATSSNSATARAMSFTSTTGGYIANSPALPSTTTTGKTTLLGFMYDTTNSLNKWRLFESSNA